MSKREENLSKFTQNLKSEKSITQNKFQDPMQNEVPDFIQDEIPDSVQNEVPNPNQNEVPGTSQEVVSAPDSAQKKKAREKYPWTFRRVAAWAAIVLLLFLYVLTFISALLARPGAGRLFQFCVGMTIVVPVFAWFLIWASGKLRK